MNKFKQVSSDSHQMSLTQGRGSMSYVKVGLGKEGQGGEGGGGVAVSDV